MSRPLRVGDRMIDDHEAEEQFRAREETMTRTPYYITVDDVMFMWESGERNPEAICNRLGATKDSVEAAFRRSGLSAPWIGTL